MRYRLKQVVSRYDSKTGGTKKVIHYRRLYRIYKIGALEYIFYGSAIDVEIEKWPLYILAILDARHRRKNWNTLGVKKNLFGEEVKKFLLKQGGNEARMYGFYYILQHLDDVGYLDLLYASVYYDEREDEHFDFYGYQDMGDFALYHCSSINGVHAGYNAFTYGSNSIPGISWNEEGYRHRERYTYEEFNLLMQIHFGVYDDERLVKELEEKEKRGEFEGLEKVRFKDVLNMSDSENEEFKKRLEEYLLLRLSRKSTKGAFEDVEKRKEYDRRRPEQEQEEVVKRLNKLLRGELEIVRMR